MHCQHCGYLLWNLPTPACPECGVGFDIRRYRFRPGTVAFACPHCGQLHAGMGDRYLPATTDQAQCRACGHSMTVASMRVVPLTDNPKDAEASAAEAPPWEERQHVGRLKSWWATCMMALGSPAELGRRIGPRSDWKSAYWFAVCTLVPGLAVHGLLLFGLFALMAVASSGRAAGFLSFLGRSALVIPLVVLGTALVAPLVTVLLGAGAAHLFLRATGETRGGFGTTATCVLYGQAPLLFAAAPVCGMYLQFIWQIWALVVSILLLHQAQSVGGWRATLAMLCYPAVALALFLGLIVVLSLLT
jgi:hypothetical protein